MYQTPSKYSKNENLDSPETKNKILKYLYSSGVKLDSKYEIILNKDRKSVV